MTTLIDGPAWCDPGLSENAGRYPLAVEAPVLAGVDALVPGVSTLTRFGRYYGLYWAIAAWAGERALSHIECRQLVRRAEVGLALVSQAHDLPDKWPGQAHGVERLARMAFDEHASPRW
jgi:hypothetical protein